ncbi:MAG: hypothetical protein Q9165_000733 [Trypethelium subeluteriae]
MFAADLSWTDQHTEKVGERKARKAKEREGSVKSAGTATASDRRRSLSHWGSASTSASTDDRSGSPSTIRLKSYWKRPSLNNIRDNAKGSKKVQNDQRSENPATQPQSMKGTLLYGDSSLQSGWTISTKWPATLPSGGSLDPDEILPSPKGTSANLHSQSSSVSSFSPLSSPRSTSLAGQVTVETSLQRIEEVSKPIGTSQHPYLDNVFNLPTLRVDEIVAPTREDKIADVAPDTYSNVRPPVPPKSEERSKDKIPQAPRELDDSFRGLALGSIGTTTTIWSDAKNDKPFRRPSALRHKRSGSGRSTLTANQETPSNRKDSSDENSFGTFKETQGESPSTTSSSNHEWPDNHPPSPLPLTYFQSFIRRMEHAGPRVVYDHLREEWQEPTDETSKFEIALEKHLWVLTALHLKSMSEKFLVSGEHNVPIKRPGVRNVLELGGNIAEVLHLSALYPDASVLHLSPTPIPRIELPNQISCTPISPADLPRLPYPSSSLDTIRTSSLPSLLPSAQIPALLSECHRVLAPGGTLELRLLDPLPDRKTSGPFLRAWIEVRLLLNLEMSFRCTRPSLLIPQWVQAAGFELRSSLVGAEREREKRRWRAKVGGYGAEGSASASARNRSMSEALGMASILQVPAANDNQGVIGAYMDEEVAVMVGRELWKDVWGEFVTERKGEEKWWWKNAGCMKEALERGTKWSVSTLLAVKPEAH